MLTLVYVREFRCLVSYPALHVLFAVGAQVDDAPVQRRALHYREQQPTLHLGDAERHIRHPPTGVVRLYHTVHRGEGDGWVGQALEPACVVGEHGVALLVERPHDEVQLWVCCGCCGCGCGGCDCCGLWCRAVLPALLGRVARLCPRGVQVRLRWWRPCVVFPLQQHGRHYEQRVCAVRCCRRPVVQQLCEGVLHDIRRVHHHCWQMCEHCAVEVAHVHTTRTHQWHECAGCCICICCICIYCI